MRIWVDGQCLQTASRERGIGRYVGDFLRALAAHRPRVEVSISFNAAMADAAIEARDAVSGFIDPDCIHIWQGVAEGGEALSGRTRRRKLSELALAHHVACLKPDIALCASPFEGAEDPAVPLLSSYGHDYRIASIFFDAIPYRFPAHYLRTRRYAAYYSGRLRALRNSGVLLAISDFAAREARELVPGPKVAAIGAGVSDGLLDLAKRPTDRSVLDSLGIHRPFVLYVGSLDWRKNVRSVADGFALLPQDLRTRLQFVVTGPPQPHFERELTTRWFGHSLPPENLKLLGYVSYQTLAQLYRQCELVVQPSIMEGFGLTALEAMCCGAPVIAANAGALPELIDDPRALFDPGAPQEIADRLANVAANGSLRQALAETGRRRAKQFRWEKAARRALAALGELAGGMPAGRQGCAIAEVRKTTAKSLGPWPRRSFAAPVLAAAEPYNKKARKLLIDVTSTCIHDGGTGIQRVVKQTAANLLQLAAEGGPEAALAYCDSHSGLRRARFGGPNGATLEPCPADAGLAIERGDTILMLDSSWVFHREHRALIRQARLLGCEVIATIYDLVPLRAPAFCGSGVPEIFSEWFQTILKYATGFVCISKTVADELIALLEAIRYPRPVKIGYWRLGANLEVRDGSLPVEALNCPDPMFLMVGTIEPRKGYRVALEAFSALWREGFPGSLCIAGKKGWETEHLMAQMRGHPQFGDRLRWVENASDGELHALYRSCTALIAASYMEGFGLPIAEAAAHGKPVLASDLPVFHEAAAGAPASFFETGSAAALAAAVRGFVANGAPGQAGAKAAGAFLSWRESAKQLRTLIFGGGWYRLYEPREALRELATAPLAIGDTKMRAPLGGKQRANALEIVEGPISRDGGRVIKFVVKVCNLSESLWSSADRNAPFSVTLGYHLIGDDGSIVSFDNPRAFIPFVLPPKDCHYIGVEIPADCVFCGARYVDFELCQEGVQWWGNPLRVSLLQAVETAPELQGILQ